MSSEKKISTRSVHSGELRLKGSVTTPVFQTSTYYFKNTEEIRKYTGGEAVHYEYGRYGNPTREAAEKKLADLEGAEDCVLFDSGMSAVTCTLLTFTEKGQHIVMTDDAYKKTLSFAAKVLPRFGIASDIVPMGDYGVMTDAIRENTAVLLSESPTNPYLNIADIEAVSRMASEKGVLSAIDATFAGPFNQCPLDAGIDIVIHSTTKSLAGHNDVLGGAVLGRRELTDRIRDFQETTGGIPDPHACYLLIRGLKTYPLRAERLNCTAQAVAEFLEAHPAVEKVYYPGLKSHQHHEIARRQMKGFGGVVTFVIRGGLENASSVLDHLELCLIAPSLGGTETLITHPALVSYYDCTPEERKDLGIGDGLFRLAVGMEDPSDLIADLDRALNTIV